MKHIPCVNAEDMPLEVLDYCVENKISTHYDNAVACIKDDGNPFAEWLKENDYTFSDNEYGDYIAIIAT